LPDAPSFFGDSAVCNANKNVRQVQLTWEKVSGASGYNLYKGGSLYKEFKAGTNLFNDEATYDQDVVYELAAVNENGTSERLSLVSGSCK
jgi:hypothetical protein